MEVSSLRKSDSSSSLSFRAPISIIRFERNEPPIVDGKARLVAFVCGDQIKLYDYSSKRYVDENSISHVGLVSSVAFLEFNEQFFLFAASEKVIKGWNVSVSPIKCTIELKANKRIGSLIAHDGHLIYGDKFGEVHRVPLNADGTFGKPSFLLSHVSIITDMSLSPDYSLLLTSDRDEKVRVSRYPQSYIIESYCLGHRDFVSGMVIPSSYPDLLITGSGDGTLRLWSYRSGTELEVHNHRLQENFTVVIPLCFSSKSSALAVVVLVIEKNAEGVTKEVQRTVYLYSLTIDENDKQPHLKQRQRLDTEEGVWVTSGAFDGEGRLWLVGSQNLSWPYPIALYEQREPGAVNFYRKLEPNETASTFTKLLTEASFIVEESRQKELWDELSGAVLFKREVDSEEKKQHPKKSKTTDE